MYSLLQAILLVHKRLVNYLDGYSYAPIKFTNGLWKHCNNQLTLTLVVDYFGVKCIDRYHAKYLISALKDLYKVTNDWTISIYVSLTLDCQYDKGHVNVSMPGYIAKMLHKFHHPKPTITDQPPYTHTKPNYRAKVHLTVPEDTSDPCPPKYVNRLKQVIGSIIFYV